MKIEIEVGIQEKHSVEFRWGQFFGTSSIRVDGTIALRGRPVALDDVALLAHKYAYLYSVIADRQIPWQRIRSWDLEVGDTEKHYIRVEKERPRLFAGARPHTYRVFVDGKLTLERTGY